MTDKPQLIEAWIDSDIIEGEVEHRIEMLKEEGEEEINKEIIWGEVIDDSSFWQWEWDTMVDNLTSELKDRNPEGYWAARVKNFGWKKLEGDKVFHADTGEKFLHEVLPNTDNQFKIYVEGKKRVLINNAHHDSPMWNEWYYIDPITEEEYMELR